MSTIQNTLGKMSNYRWTICAMLFFATTVNYLDRQVLSLTWMSLSNPNFTGTNHITVQLQQSFHLYMQPVCYLQVVSWIGWDLKKDIYGLSASGL